MKSFEDFEDDYREEVENPTADEIEDAYEMYELYWDMDPDMREEWWDVYAEMMPWFEWDEETGEWKYVG